MSLHTSAAAAAAWSAASASWCGAAMAAGHATPLPPHTLTHSSLPPHTLTHSPSPTTSQPPAEIGDFWTQNNASGRCAQLVWRTNGRVHSEGGEAGTRAPLPRPAPRTPATSHTHSHTYFPSHTLHTGKLIPPACRAPQKAPVPMPRDALATVKTP